MKHFGRNDSLPEGAQLFRKKTVVEMVPMAEPFTCDSREHDGLQAQAGDFLVPDGHGGFYPVSAEFHAANYEPATPPSAALVDVAAERERQKSVEGFDHEHDDEHSNGSLAQAAAAYAECAAEQALGGTPDQDIVPGTWPSSWDESYFRPKDQRRNLVVAGALILAEIERLDRAAAAAGYVPKP